MGKVEALAALDRLHASHERAIKERYDLQLILNAVHLDLLFSDQLKPETIALVKEHMSRPTKDGESE